MAPAGPENAASARPVRLFIATTAGPVHIQRITREDPDVSSVVCLGGKAVALPISGAYDAFVRDPTGVVQRRFGHGAFRVDVSAPVDDGYSWQLGLFLAHAAEAACGLAAEDDKDAPAFIITGEVDRDLNVHRVDHVAAKFAHLEGAHDVLQDATVVLPRENANDAHMPDHAVVTVETVAEAMTALGLPPLAEPAPVQATPGAGRAEPGRPRSRLGRWVLFGLLLVCALVGAAVTVPPATDWIALYDRGRAADLHRALDQSKDFRAPIAEALLRFRRPGDKAIKTSVDGGDGGLNFRVQGPNAVFLSGRGLRWLGDGADTRRPERVVFFDPRPGALVWRPEIPKGVEKTGAVFRLVVLASRRPLSGPQPWFPALNALGLSGRAGERARDVRDRLARAGITAVVVEHRLDPK